jgi:uncharacterized protein YbaP (TraB family)
MKQHKRLPALLLCLCLIVGLLAGCGQQAGQENAVSPAPTSEPTAAPTPEPPDYGEIYRAAAEDLGRQENLRTETRITQELILPDYAAATPGAQVTITEKTTRTGRYQGLGGDAPLAVVEDVVVLDPHPRVEQRLVYAEGLEYVELNGAKYCSEQDAAAFLDSRPPLLLLDAALYGDLSGEETAGGYSLRFEAPSGGESWALPEDAELLEASGTASVTGEGVLTGASYELRYLFGGVTVHTRYELSYSPAPDLDLRGEVPESARGWESLDDPEAPMAVLRAGRLLTECSSVSADLNFRYYSEAAGILLYYSQDESFLNQSGTSLYHGTFNVSGLELSDQSVFSYSYEEDFSRGALSTAYSDGTEDREPMSSREAQAYFLYTVALYFPGFDQLKDAESRDVGAYRLISFSGTEDYGAIVKDGVQGDVFPSQPTILDDYASAYLTKNLTGFLAVEKVTGLPTALNLDYTGIHTIDGAPYELSMALNMGLKLYTEDAAFALLDEPIEEPEPEQRPSPVFYQVSDAEGHTLYLLGTIHIGDARTAWLPQVIYDALDASDALAVEFDTESFQAGLEEDPELQRRILESFYYTDGSSIQNHLDSDVYKLALDYLKVSGNYTETAESMKPTLWENALELFYLSQGRRLSSEKGVDNRLMRLARDADKEILNVESGEFQIGMLTGYSDPVQEMLLAEIITTPRGEYLNSSYELYEAWCTGDEDALIRRLSAMDEEERAALDEEERAIYDEYHQKMEVERNANMVEVAKGYLDSGRTVFFAVGLAHLLGEGGLVEALRAEGYTVTLIDTH